LNWADTRSHARTRFVPTLFLPGGRVRCRRFRARLLLPCKERLAFERSLGDAERRHSCVRVADGDHGVEALRPHERTVIQTTLPDWDERDPIPPLSAWEGHSRPWPGAAPPLDAPAAYWPRTTMTLVGA
jgi:hypothetical protein